MKRLKNLLRWHKFSYEVWSNGRLLSKGQGHRGTIKFEFEYALDNLALGSDSGESFAFTVTKVSK